MEIFYDSFHYSYSEHDVKSVRERISNMKMRGIKFVMKRTPQSLNPHLSSEDKANKTITIYSCYGISDIYSVMDEMIEYISKDNLMDKISDLCDEVSVITNG
jgi:hypothetical protein